MRMLRPLNECMDTKLVQPRVSLFAPQIVHYEKMKQYRKRLEITRVLLVNVSACGLNYSLVDAIARHTSAELSNSRAEDGSTQQPRHLAMCMCRVYVFFIADGAVSRRLVRR